MQNTVTEREYRFELLLRDDDTLVYSCTLCTSVESGGSPDNPELFSRMRAHLKRLHDIAWADELQPIYLNTGEDSALVTLGVESALD